LSDSDEAGANRFAIQQNRARAAIARIATNLRSRQPEIIAQNAGQPLPWRTCDG
jgi:hypothetical protein